MNGKTHVATSIALSFGVATILGVEPNFELAAGTALGALLPDIDHPNSILGRRLWGKHIPPKDRAKIAYKTHRKFTHYPEVWLVGSLILAFFYASSYPNFIGGVIIGWLGHLLGDMCTKSGIPSKIAGTLKFPITYRSGTPSVEYMFIGLSIILISIFLS
ncbi:putative membrane-bound metal-dependent hydrolase [Bacillus phage SP-15]|uniref:Putative membrane-bound metal-dependent hydrolase n=1 Tax=Bacillus phage SP-15 TaxID=1792032 RepID=A0A127AVX7_9CAUD|nr:putative membrane-bound metal-dependent hydrolase [Bacillus phage SP-15]AMM44815.1 putative membrane-bound metal-dependent hydrolase [Bacillus phage SP-15]